MKRMIRKRRMRALHKISSRPRLLILLMFYVTDLVEYDKSFLGDCVMQQVSIGIYARLCSRGV